MTPQGPGGPAEAKAHGQKRARARLVAWKVWTGSDAAYTAGDQASRTRCVSHLTTWSRRRRSRKPGRHRGRCQEVPWSKLPGVCQAHNTGDSWGHTLAARLLGRPTKSRRLQSSCRSSSCFLSSPAVCLSPPYKRFFSDVSTRVGATVPGSQGARVPGLWRDNIAPKLPRSCREWRAPDTMRQLETSPAAAAATATARHAAAAGGGVPGILAPFPGHPGTLSLAFWQCPGRCRGASEATWHRVAWPGYAPSFPVLEGGQPVRLRP